MYDCMTAKNLNNILNQLILWCQIASEHPVFLRTISKSSHIQIPDNIEAKLDEVIREFSIIREKAFSINSTITANTPVTKSHVMEVMDLISKFLPITEQVLKFLPEVRQIDTENTVWQELCKYIEELQVYMHETFTELFMSMCKLEAK